MPRRPAGASPSPAAQAVLDAVRDALAPLHAAPGEHAFCVALSGGLDSSVLLHAAVRAGIAPLRAIHVNHQLNERAADWARHCERLCAALGVPLLVRTVDVSRAGGEGPEAAARLERYRALAAALQPGEAVFTAHHRDDQAETVLINLLRGAGVAGLRGIPARSVVLGCQVVRPLLELPRTALRAYAEEVGLSWVEDPSNRDARIARSFLRNEVMPKLTARWPGAAVTIARASRLCGESAELVDALAQLDARRLVRRGRIDLGALRVLGAARQANVLRFLCRQRLGSVPPEERLREGLQQLLNAGPDRNPLLAWPGGEIRRYRDALYVQRPLGPPPRGHELRIPARAGCGLDIGEPLGRLRLVRARGQGLAAARTGPELVLRFRAGGERLRPAGTKVTRELKNLLQERGVVPWMRERIPLLYAGESLVAVAGLWVADEFAAVGTEPGLRVRWEDHPALD